MFRGSHIRAAFLGSLLLLCAGLQAQVSVAGRVVDETGSPVPGARIEWLARCGHFPPSEQPEELVFFIRSFLKKLE